MVDPVRYGERFRPVLRSSAARKLDQKDEKKKNGAFEKALRGKEDGREGGEEPGKDPGGPHSEKAGMSSEDRGWSENGRETAGDGDDKAVGKTVDIVV